MEAIQELYVFICFLYELALTCSRLDKAENIYQESGCGDIKGYSEMSLPSISHNANFEPFSAWFPDCLQFSYLGPEMIEGFTYRYHCIIILIDLNMNF